MVMNLEMPSNTTSVTPLVQSVDPREPRNIYENWKGQNGWFYSAG